jgi:hypothetical protein
VDGLSDAAAFLPFLPFPNNPPKKLFFFFVAFALPPFPSIEFAVPWDPIRPGAVAARSLVGSSSESSSESNMPEGFGLSRVAPVPAMFALPGRLPRKASAAAALAFARPTSDATSSHGELPGCFAGVAAAASASASSAMVSIVCVGAGAGGVECEGPVAVAGVAVCVMAEAGASDVVAKVPSWGGGADCSRMAGSCTWSLSWLPPGYGSVGVGA